MTKSNSRLTGKLNLP